MESADRAYLMGQILKSSPGPEDPHHLLVLPSVREVHAMLPEQSEIFAARRSALYADLVHLTQRKIHTLSDTERCRRELLNLLFGDSQCVVGECWQRIIAAIGPAALPAFNAALERIIGTGCIEIVNTVDTK